MKVKKVLLLFCVSLFPLLATAQVNEWAEDNEGQTREVDESIVGRWDLNLDTDDGERPSWLEVKLSGFGTLVGRFVSMEGSARPISEVHFKNNIVFFSIPPQWSNEPNDLQLSGKLDKDENKLIGAIKQPNGEKLNFKGERAPIMKRSEEPDWGGPIQLIKGQDLNDVWEAKGDNQWQLKNNILKSPHSGSNLVTKEKFKDFKLHAEVKYPEGSNSGIYLRGRHEIQVVDSSGVEEPADNITGAVYGFIEPSELASKGSGEWEELDITLIGRHVTVKLNGTTIIKDRRIPGITGGALDSNEDKPGPIYLQGDHGPVQYRNMVITPAKD